MNLIRLSKESGVKLFVPSEFGIPLFRIPDEDGFGLKNQSRKLLNELKIKWIGFYNFFFTDYGTSKYFGFDVEKGEVQVPGGKSDIKVSMTTREDVARFVVETVLDPETAKSTQLENLIEFAGDTTTWEELTQLLEQTTGKKLKRVPVSEEYMKKEMHNHSNPFWWISLLHYNVFKGRGASEKPTPTKYNIKSFESIKSYVSKHFKKQ